MDAATVNALFAQREAALNAGDATGYNQADSRIRRVSRIIALRERIIRRSIDATNNMRSPDCDWQAINAHNAINHRTTLNKYPEVAAYWARQRNPR